jgi:hypothetical protein
MSYYGWLDHLIVRKKPKHALIPKLMKDNNELKKKKRIREQDKKKSWKKDEKVFRSKCLI